MTCCSCFVVPCPLDDALTQPRVREGHLHSWQPFIHCTQPGWSQLRSCSITASWMEGRDSVACLSSRATTTADGRVRMVATPLLRGFELGQVCVRPWARRAGKLERVAATPTVKTRGEVYIIYFRFLLQH